jgi:hypothetical protein
MPPAVGIVDVVRSQHRRRPNRNCERDWLMSARHSMRVHHRAVETHNKAREPLVQRQRDLSEFDQLQSEITDYWLRVSSQVGSSARVLKSRRFVEIALADAGSPFLGVKNGEK